VIARDNKRSSLFTAVNDEEKSFNSVDTPGRIGIAGFRLKMEVIRWNLYSRLVKSISS
jgi:hypothetical protein